MMKIVRSIAFRAVISFGIGITMLLATSINGDFIHTAFTAPPTSPLHIVFQEKPLALSAPPRIVQGTTTVPLRDISRSLGATVTWVAETTVSTAAQADHRGQRIVLTRGDQTATVTIGQRTIERFDRKMVTMEVAPYVSQGITMVPLRPLVEIFGKIVTWDAYAQRIAIRDPIALPTFDSEQSFQKWLENNENSTKVQIALPTGPITRVRAEATATTSPDAPPATSETTAYSPTNVQVMGVDEADEVKTNGKLLAQISAGRVLVTDISQRAQAKITATIDYTAESFQPIELYMDETHLIVIGQQTMPIAGDVPVKGADENRPERKSIRILPIEWPRTTIKTFIYALSVAGQLERTRMLEQEGTLVSTRKIDGTVYVISNKSNFYNVPPPPGVWCENCPTEQTTPPQPATFEPLYFDSISQPSYEKIPLRKIQYFPESKETSMMLIGAFSIDRPQDPLHIQAYMGAGQAIYASKRHLYVATTTWDTKATSLQNIWGTHVYKFRLDAGTTTYVGQTHVPGKILNQFSMDEHDGYFRIATTAGEMWGQGANTSDNQLYVIDEQLKVIGSLTGLAPGERIYAVRFIGPRAYMVTFRNVDPLFVLDLREPNKPTVLGQLKIPGYSDYLHPFDENHLIGFGKETIELPTKSWGGDETTAYYQGMKIALFDVSDVTNPKEKFKKVIGDRGTHSDVLQNHKALLFWKETGLLAFPVDLYEIPEKKNVITEQFPQYGQFVYQGAYVYHLNATNGFELRGRITHLSDEDLLKSGTYGYDQTKRVKRALIVKDVLYTLSEHMLKANQLVDLIDLQTLPYPTQSATNPNASHEPTIRTTKP